MKIFIATIYICYIVKTLLQFIIVRVKYCYDLYICLCVNIATFFYLLEWNIATIHICLCEILLKFIFVYLKYCRSLDNLHRAS